MGHPKVKEAAVLAARDKVWGESFKALIVRRKEEKTGEEKLMNYCRERLPTFQCPRSIEFIEDLPRNASGKMPKKPF